MIIKMSACQIVKNIRQRRLTVVDVAQAFIKRIKEVNPMINAIHQFDPERILLEAKQKDAEIAAGKKLGKLHGLPISLKDGFYSLGFHGAKGSIALYNSSPTNKTATIVQRLIDEGVIILGITNVPEFLAASETDNLLHGRTVNPYDVTKVAGGSSGGEAALIATGGSCVGIGSDAIGSIREPAAYCGITGLKPTKGLVPLTGLIPADGGGLKADLSMYGPMARNIEDLELILSVIVGPDYKDPACAPVPLQNSHSVNVASLRVLYFLDDGVTTPDTDTMQSVQASIERIRPYVANTNLIQPPDILKDTYKLAYETCYLEGNKGELYDARFAKIGQTEFSPLYTRYLKDVYASEFSNAELHRRIAQIFNYKRAMLDLMQNADILLCPTTPTPARKHGTAHDELNDFEYTMFFNLTGWPAASVNCGFSRAGLPIGLQIAAKPWQDHLVLALARKAQELFGIPDIVNPKI